MKNVGAKILRVMAEVESVEKDGFNAFHKYKYTSDAAIVTAIRQSLIKNGLSVIPDQKSCSVSGDITTLCISYTLLDTESGESMISSVYGQGQDKGDKGVYKAATGAEKYFLLKTFLIPTDDDPENDRKSKKTYEKSEYDQRPQEEVEYNTGIRPFAGYTALNRTDPKEAQKRIGEGYYVKNTPNGVFIFTKHAPTKEELSKITASNPQDAVISEEEVVTIKTLVKDKGMKPSDFTAYIKSVYGISLAAEIKKKDYSDIYQWVIVNSGDATNG